MTLRRLLIIIIIIKYRDFLLRGCLFLAPGIQAEENTALCTMPLFSSITGALLLERVA